VKPGKSRQIVAKEMARSVGKILHRLVSLHSIFSATSRNSKPDAARIKQSDRVGPGRDGLPGRASARRPGGKRALMLVYEAAEAFTAWRSANLVRLMLVTIGH
jgi:hypothetical protein